MGWVVSGGGGVSDGRSPPGPAGDGKVARERPMARSRFAFPFLFFPLCFFPPAPRLPDTVSAGPRLPGNPARSEDCGRSRRRVEDRKVECLGSFRRKNSEERVYIFP